MSSTIIAVVVGALAAVVCVYLLLRQRSRPIQNRASQDIEEIFKANYASNGIDINEFRRHWIAISNHLKEDPKKLRPSDRFDSELRYRNPLDESNDDLVDYAKAQLGAATDLSKIATLNELILLLCKRR